MNELSTRLISAAQKLLPMMHIYASAIA